MSRSKPNENAPNPSVRWFEWDGEHGGVRYYDKDAKQTVSAGENFRFLLLDEVGSVRGWHDASQSGIYSNEVRDTRKDVLIVKAFKAGTLAEGVYKAIKDRVNAVGGRFVSNLYVAFKHNGDELAIGSLRFKGAALQAWMEFRKANRGFIYKKAIEITGYTEGKKGRVVFRVPTFRAVDISPATDKQALGLDAELQAWLAAYFARNTKEQAEPVPQHEPEFADSELPPATAELTDEDIPFAFLLPFVLPLTGALSLLAMGA